MILESLRICAVLFTAYVSRGNHANGLASFTACVSRGIMQADLLTLQHVSPGESCKRICLLYSMCPGESCKRTCLLYSMCLPGNHASGFAYFCFCDLLLQEIIPVINGLRARNFHSVVSFLIFLSFLRS
jgi:hypothetical protein